MGTAGPVSRGYREEMEHFAYCIRMRDPDKPEESPKPRCHGRVAMADAIVAHLTSASLNKPAPSAASPACPGCPGVFDLPGPLPYIAASAQFGQFPSQRVP